MTHDCDTCVWADDEGVCVRESCYLLEEEKKEQNEKRMEM